MLSRARSECETVAMLSRSGGFATMKKCTDDRPSSASLIGMMIEFKLRQMMVKNRQDTIVEAQQSI